MMISKRLFKNQLKKGFGTTSVCKCSQDEIKNENLYYFENSLMIFNILEKKEWKSQTTYF